MKQYIILLFTFFAFLTIVSCQSPAVKQGGVELQSPTAFVESYAAETDAVLIDCRTPGEVSRGTIEGALNIDYTSSTFTAEIQKLDKAKPIYIYCQSGGRSGSAAKQLESLGFEEVHDMKGGFGAYSRK